MDPNTNENQTITSTSNVINPNINDIKYEDVIKLLINWNSYQKLIYILPSLCKSNLKLQEMFLNLMLIRQLYFAGVDTYMTDDEYDSMKNRVFTELYQWHVMRKQKSKTSFHDNLVKQLHYRVGPQSVIMPKSRYQKLDVSICFDNYTKVTDNDLERVNTLSLTYLISKSIFILGFEDNDEDFSKQYVKLLTEKYLYMNGKFDEMQCIYQGKQGFNQLINDIHQNNILIINWAKLKYYSGEKGINDIAYDIFCREANMRALRYSE